MDVVEYLLNFIERLEEGLNQNPQNLKLINNSKIGLSLEVEKFTE